MDFNDVLYTLQTGACADPSHIGEARFVSGSVGSSGLRRAGMGYGSLARAMTSVHC
jgi:hypothetical protein